MKKCAHPNRSNHAQTFSIFCGEHESGAESEKILAQIRSKKEHEELRLNRTLILEQKLEGITIQELQAYQTKHSIFI
jgi:hypothetical protein